MHDLRDKGNTLLVVEHEEAVIRAADHLIEIGPGRGEQRRRLGFQRPARGDAAWPTRALHILDRAII